MHHNYNIVQETVTALNKVRDNTINRQYKNVTVINLSVNGIRPFTDKFMALFSKISRQDKGRGAEMNLGVGASI